MSDLDRTVSHFEPPNAQAESQYLQVTVLCHPDLRRVGESTSVRYKAGRTLKLSRTTPEFSNSEGTSGGILAERRISRTPLTLLIEEDGALAINVPATGTRVLIDRKRSSGLMTIEPDRLERGVVIELGGATALLIFRRGERPKSASAETWGLLGQSPEIVRIRKEIARVGEVDVPVLLRGETGTGKELVARALHAASRRRDRPFVAVNMAAIAKDLVSAELFGATAGAYSGAAKTRRGYFHEAAGGTLFLDEIGDVQGEVQTALLRAIETGEVQAVGASRPEKIDVRIVAATDSNLETAIQRGNFRAPLLHRLAGYEMVLPSLADRPEDIAILFFSFLREELAPLGASSLLSSSREQPFTPASVIAELVAYSWPGNVRQLRNLARQLAISCQDRPHLELSAQVRHAMRRAMQASGPTQRDFETASDKGPPLREPKVGRRYRDPNSVPDDEILAALRQHQFRIKPTAADLNIARSSLHDRIDRMPGVRRASTLERKEIMKLLAEHGTEVPELAAVLEVSPEALKRRMRDLGLL